MEILELTLLTNDINETEKFYNKRLGLPISGKDATSVSFLTQNSKLTFKKSSSQNPFYHFAFTIPNNRIEDALSWAKRKVNAIDIEPGIKIADFAGWNAKSFYFLDNNKNILEFIARFDLDNKSDLGFDSSSILCVSEIGIPSDHVVSEAQQTSEKYGIAYFSKQPALENFTVLGDDNGLFIFAETKRHWYPTNIPSERHWALIKIKENNRIFEIAVES